MPTHTLPIERFPVNWGQLFRRAEPYIIGIGVPVGAALIAVCLPLLYSQGQQIATLQGKLDQLSQHTEDVVGGDEKLETTQFTNLAQRFDDHFTSLGQKFDDRFSNLSDELNHRFGTIDNSIAQYNGAIGEIDKRLDQAELDPLKMLKLAGISDANVEGAFMYRGILYIIPRTNAANQTLALNGFHSEQLTPALSAYKVTDKVFVAPNITIGPAPANPPP
jgi:hypothetical protein